MAWLYVTGVINFNPGSITEDQFLGPYSLFSSCFKGSEGGLNISFTKTKCKNWISSSESDYYVDDIYRLENVVISGGLRGITGKHSQDIVKEFKDFLYTVRDRINPNHPSFTIQYMNEYWNMCIVGQKVRVNKNKFKY